MVLRQRETATVWQTVPVYTGLYDFTFQLCIILCFYLIMSLFLSHLTGTILKTMFGVHCIMGAEAATEIDQMRSLLQCKIERE